MALKMLFATCKEAIVVTNPELSAVRDADRVIGILNTSDIEPIQLVINRVRPNMMASQEIYLSKMFKEFFLCLC